MKSLKKLKKKKKAQKLHPGLTESCKKDPSALSPQLTFQPIVLLGGTMIANENIQTPLKEREEKSRGSRAGPKEYKYLRITKKSP